MLASVDDVQETSTGSSTRSAPRHRCDEGGSPCSSQPARTAAYSTVATLEVDAIQYRLDEGPCLDAARLRGEFVANLGVPDSRWPRFAEAVRDDGVRSVMALPLVSGDQCVGALNLYGYQRHAFDAFEASLARVAAARAADAIVASSRSTGPSARRPARSGDGQPAVIEQARALMAMRGIDEHSAFDWLRQTSQNRNVKLRSVAENVVAGVSRSPQVVPDRLVGPALESCMARPHLAALMEDA